MRSIERYLLAWIAGALSFGLVVVALVGYLVMQDEMNEVFDDNLRNVAQALVTHRQTGPGANSNTASAPPPTDPIASDEYGIVTAIWTAGGQRLYSSDPSLDLPFSSKPGPSRLRSGDAEWVVHTVVRKGVVARAAQRVASRQKMAGESAASVLPPMLVLVLVASALTAYALRRGLRSLDEAAREVAARSERSLDPVPTAELPREILPIVKSVNGLMVRLAAALTAQRRFLADAAHELRTPATALRLQLQLLERAEDDATRAAAMLALKSGVERSQRLIEQLLQVARSGPDGEPVRTEPVDLGALVREVVGELSIKAEHRNIDLGADADAGVFVVGDAEQLTVLLNNLVENALRYTPSGGVVDVEARLHHGAPLLRVIDNGPGIPAAQRERVFDRFYRGDGAREAGSDAGSGLGLAIVRTIADRHLAVVELHTPGSGVGLQVDVLFPGQRVS